MSTEPMDDLEQRAAEQRRHFHGIADEVKTRIDETREDLTLKNQCRKRFWGAAGIACAASLLFGYSFTGMFTSR